MCLAYANNINTEEGGAHLTGFRSALTATLNKYVPRKAAILKENDVNLSGDDVRDGLTAVISVKLQEPQFEGQTKTKLGNSEVTGQVSTVLSDALMQYLEENPAEAKRIVEQSLTAARARQAAARARELVQRKSLPRVGDPPRQACRLQRAGSRALRALHRRGGQCGWLGKQGRERRNQAILPLRGKILNVEKARADKILAQRGDQEPDHRPRRRIRRHHEHRQAPLPPHRADGRRRCGRLAHRTLLLTFFWRHLQEVIFGGYLYLGTAPALQAQEGNAASRSGSSTPTATPSATPSSRRWAGAGSRSSVQGTGRDEPRELWETTMDPAKRVLLQVTVEDALKADEIFDKLMGSDVEPPPPLHPDPRPVGSQPGRLMEQSGTPGGTHPTATPITVAVDAMSGDNGPQAAVLGALEAALKDDIRVLLVGDRERLQALSEEWRGLCRTMRPAPRRCCATHVEIVPAGSVIGMDEHPAQAVRSKKDASVVVATRLVAEGRAQAAALRRQQRCHPGRRAAHRGAHPRGRAARHRDDLPHPDPHHLHLPARHRRQRRLQAALAAAIRRDGQHLRAPDDGGR